MMSAAAESHIPHRLVGKGPIRVMVAHGWIADHELYQDFIPLIDQDRYTFCFFACRGYGDRVAEAGELTIEGIAKDAMALADLKGWDRFHVLGHSMGGMSAQRLMADQPDRMKSVILVAPVPASGARLDDVRRAAQREAAASKAVRRKLIDRNSGGIRSEALLDRVLDISWRSTDIAALQDYIASWADSDFSAEVKGCDLPTHVILGELDPSATTDRIQATIMSWFPRASLTTLRGIGHYPMIEEPRAFYDAVVQALDGPDGR